MNRFKGFVSNVVLVSPRVSAVSLFSDKVLDEPRTKTNFRYHILRTFPDERLFELVVIPIF